MIIERLTIGHFGNLDGLTLELGPRLNIIRGENETGKSTVAAFIRYMLYGFGTAHSPDDLPEREKRVSWTAAAAEGSMDIRLADGRRFRIERSTKATEGTGRVGYLEDSRLTDLTDGSVARFRTLPGEEFFSVPEQVYVNTAFFGQFSDAKVNEGEMTQAMENILFSGDERVNSLRALRTLRQARNSLSHPSGVGGAIYELTAQADAMRLRLSQAVRLNAQIHRTETELHKLSEKIAAAERERDRLAEIDKDYENYMAICTFDKLHEVENTHAALAAEHEALRRDYGTNGFLPDEDYLASLVSAERVLEISRKNYLRSAEKLASVREESVTTPEAEAFLRLTDEGGGAETIAATYTGLYKNALVFRVTAWLLAAVAAALLGVGAFLIRPFTFSPVMAILLLFVLASTVLSVLFFRTRRRTERRIGELCRRYEAATGADLLCKLSNVEATRRILSERRENILRAEENVAISLKNFEDLRAELSALISRWRERRLLGSPEEAVEAVSTEVRAYLAEDRRLSEAVAEARGKVEALREELRGVSEISIRALLSPHNREKMKRINHKTVQEGLSYYRTTCDNFHKQYRVLLDELDEYRKNAENPAELRAEFSVTDERIRALRDRFRAYGIAADAIASAQDSLRAEISPRLSEYAANLLSLATDGRYSSIEVTNRLSMSYQGDGAQRPLPSMSGGTREIAYISLRLALIDMLYKEKPPLCFDESMAHQDDGRTENIFVLLDTIAETEGMQSILFTCHSREATIAERVSAESRCISLERRNNCE